MCAAAPSCERNGCLDQVRQEGEVKRGCDMTRCDRRICVNDVDILFREFLRWDGEEELRTREFGSALVSPLAANFAPLPRSKHLSIGASPSIWPFHLHLNSAFPLMVAFSTEHFAFMLLFICYL